MISNVVTTTDYPSAPSTNPGSVTACRQAPNPSGTGQYGRAFDRAAGNQASS